MKNQTKISFQYQNFMLRAFAFVPVILLMAYGEYAIYGKYMDGLVYLILSVVIMYLVVFALFKKTAFLFTGKGHCIQTGREVQIVKKTSKITIPLEEITDLEYKYVAMYGISLMKLTITFNRRGRSRVCSLYSEDIPKDGAGKASLQPVFRLLKPHAQHVTHRLS